MVERAKMGILPHCVLGTEESNIHAKSLTRSDTYTSYNVISTLSYVLSLYQ